MIFTFFIILYVDFQLRTGSSPPRLRVVQAPAPGAPQRAIQQAAALLPPASGAHEAAGTNNNSRSNGGNGGGGGDGGFPVQEDARVTAPPLRQEDIFIAVKTTGRFHATRLALLLETWISRTKAHVSPLLKSIAVVVVLLKEL